MENKETKTKVLVVDDDKRILQILKLYLVKDGYDVITCERGDEAIDPALDPELGIVILDSFEQYENASLSILFTEFGIDTLVNSVQYQNAPSMLVTG